MRIGVFGGSFDPVHVGHLAVAQSLSDQLALDQTRWVPVGRQPFKPDGPAASGRDREAMLALAIGTDPQAVIDRRELDRPGPSYTVDTLASLRRDLPHDQLFLLVGADTARHLGAWRDAERVTRLARVVAFSRAGIPAPETDEISETVTVPNIDVSASAIRAAVREGRDIRGLVPDAVREYIRHHDLYITKPNAQTDTH